MIDINDKEYLEKLRKAVASDEGQAIIEYIQHSFDNVSYSSIDRDKNFEEIGRAFAVCYNIKEELGRVIAFLNNLVK